MNYLKHCIQTGSDFYEMGSGNLFRISEYISIKESGLPNPYGGIRVSDIRGNIIGYVPEDKIEEILKQPD